MADAFQPKFADLVRNYTTSSGTDDFVLGPAVNGFASFADACAVGDHFYYSALGVDNPGDTEVGRGTLLAGGVIARDPFSGKRTNFKTGTKSVALVAAAEWFAEVDAVRSSAAGMLNVKAFGAAGDSDSNGSVGSDDTAAFQAAIEAIGAQGGGTLYVPDGYYKISSYLTVAKNLTLSMSAGATIVATHAGGGGTTPAEDLRNGSIFYGNWPSNSSTPAHIIIEGGTLRCANGANQGAAFYDNCGSFIQLRDIRAYAFKYGFVFDQSELVDVTQCEVSAADAGGACIWLVNGPTLTAGNQGTFTNRISVQRCQINAGSTVYGILDDGGTTHAFSDNNYNGCLNHIRAAGVLGLMIEGGEFESASGPPVWLDFLALDGSGVGSCSQAHFDAPVIVPAGTNPCVHIQGGGTLVFTAPFFGNTSSPKVVGTGNVFALYSVGAINVGGGATFDGQATNHWEVGNAGGAIVQKTNIAFASKKFEVPGTIRATAAATLTSGAGVEVLHNGGSGAGGLGSVLAYDRDLGQWQTLQLGGSAIKLQAGGSDVAVVSPAGLDLTGALTASNIGSAAARAESDFLQPGNNLGDVGSALAAAQNLRTGHVLAQSGGPISYTGGTAEVTLATISVPANAMGPNGRIELKVRWSFTGANGTKAMKVKLAGVTIANNGSAPTRTGYRQFVEIQNRASASLQFAAVENADNTAAQAYSTVTSAVDTAANQDVTITAQLANAADTVTLESFQVILYPDEAA